jgi:hypothetical protein
VSPPTPDVLAARCPQSYVGRVGVGESCACEDARSHSRLQVTSTLSTSRPYICPGTACPGRRDGAAAGEHIEGSDRRQPPDRRVVMLDRLKPALLPRPDPATTLGRRDLRPSPRARDATVPRRFLADGSPATSPGDHACHPAKLPSGTGRRPQHDDTFGTVCRGT